MIAESQLAQLDWPHSKISMRISSQIEAGMRLSACKKEPWTTQWLEQMPVGSIYFDLGACVGGYVLCAVSRGIVAVALEPSYTNFASLCRNLVENHWLDRCYPFQVAASNRTTLDWFQYSSLVPGAASHLIGQPPGQQPIWHHRQAVQLWRLDDLIQTFGLPQPTHIKLDIDGGESMALAGAPKALAGAKSLMIEVKPDQEAAILKGLTEQGFGVKGRWDERGGKRMGVSYLCLERAA